MSKTENDRAYERGVQDGKNGCFFDDVAQSLSRGWGISEKSDIYDKGYDYGAAHRHDSKK